MILVMARYIIQKKKSYNILEIKSDMLCRCAHHGISKGVSYLGLLWLQSALNAVMLAVTAHMIDFSHSGIMQQTYIVSSINTTIE